MNTQGWIRALMARHSTTDEFISFVSNTISKEFDMCQKVSYYKNGYRITFKDFEIKLSTKEASWLQKNSPYSLDRHLLENLKTQGLEFEVNRSQYICYCYGVFC